jgi:N-acetylglucosamine-6-phosphate deacetylase
MGTFRCSLPYSLLHPLRTWALCAIATVTTAHSAEPPRTRPVEGLQQQAPATFVITADRLVVRPGQVLEKGSLLIRDGVVEAVGAGVSIPPTARRIAIDGGWIYPGFIDAYSEIECQLPDAGASYWNQAVVPQLRAVESFKRDDSLNDRLRRQGITARLVAPSVGQIKGTSALVTTSDDGAANTVADEEVALHIALAPRRWGGGNDYPGSPMGALSLVRQALHDANWYVEVWRAYHANRKLPRPEQNDALERLAEILADRLPVIINAPNERYFMRADMLGREFALPVIVMGSGREYRRLETIVATGRFIILPLTFPKAPNVSTPEAAASATLEELMHWDLAPENLNRLVARGARIALSTHGLEKETDFLPAIRRAVHRGLAADDALRALTIWPAEMYGVGDRMGSLEIGKAANFVITDGDLFDKKTRIKETWVDGRRYRFIDSESPDVRGTWQVDLTRDSGSQSLKLALKGRQERPSAMVEVADKKERARSVLWDGTRLSVTLDARPLGQEGIAQFTLVVIGHDLETVSTLGSGTWPDGSPMTCVARREQPYSPAAQPGRAPPDDTPKDKRPEDARNRDTQGPEDKPEPAAEEEHAAAAEEPEEEGKRNREEEGGGKEEDEEEEEEEVEEPTEALFDVNYPLGASGRSGPPDQPAHVLFTNATVWTCGPEGTLENASVLVEAGRIAAVGRDLGAPDGAEIVDLAGKHLSPGIIDCHSHIATDGGVNESTQAITAEVRIGDFIDADDISIYRQLAGGVTSSNILHGSANPIGGQNQVIKMRWGADPEDLKFRDAPPGIKFALGENVKQSNWGDNNTTRYPQTRMGVDEIIVDAFRRARAYQERWSAWNRDRQGLPPRIDLELEALAEVLSGKRWIHCHSYRQSEILALMKTCDRFGIQIATFQHILEGYKVADEMARRNIMGSAFSDWWAYKFEVYDAIPYAGALMHQAGVVVSFNSDDAELGRRLNLEAAKAVKYGDVPPMEALRFVTLNPARQLRIDDRVGSLEVGKDADLVVWSGSPLSVYSRCEQTWIDGRRCFDREEDAAWQKRDQQRHAALVQRVLSTKAEQMKPEDEDRAAGDEWPREDIFCPHDE